MIFNFSFFSFLISHFSFNIKFKKDTAGQERYHSLTPMYYRGSKGAFVVYDVTDYESFKRAQDWISELESENDTDVKIALVGNKIDIQNEVVSKEEASNYAKKKGYSFYQTSAKTGEGVTEMFHGLTKSLPLEQADLDLTETDYSDSDEIRIENSNPQKNANSGCC
ncbi:ras-related protein rab-5c [Anaeramoeba flamelloides]|uniref:Ras-related protein rab-5c n=1 Tax=Anaeramoeba flamelloides TaxID=1746091 RepID=A0ABQ8YDC3_9EUKA|nr:ras-related protein rab-5c [Anaeramoeba flamelloides]